MEQAKRRAEPSTHYRPNPVSAQDRIAVVQAAVAVVLRLGAPEKITLGGEQTGPVQASGMSLNILRVARAHRTNHLLEPGCRRTILLKQDSRLPQHLRPHQAPPRVLPPRLGEL